MRTADVFETPSHPHHAGMGYRGDIDGLRAVAVLSVIFFHVGVPFVSGGYAGVDVFFVISGYLITGGIWRDLSAQKFSILAFYERRIRRIYPALLALLAVVLAVGTILLMPDGLKGLGAETTAAVAFSSNIQFWRRTDYFATAAELRPLLHTWSLAVEEQFYLVIAPLMALVFRLFKHRVHAILWGLFALSFITSCLSTQLEPATNYYLPWNRAWELLLGSIVALAGALKMRARSFAELTAAVALGLLVVPMLVLDRDSIFPAWNALPTCVGTAMLIALGEKNQSGTARLLSLAPFRWIGLISYSLYLVHWPILVFCRYQLLRDPTTAEKVALIALMIGLAWLSWRFVEVPFRKRRTAQKRLFREAAIASASLAVLGVGMFALDGIPQRMGAQATLATRDDAQASATPGCFLEGDWRQWRGDKCFLTKGSGRVVLLWGDSHANHYALALRGSTAAYPSRVLLYASGGCPPVLDLVVKGHPDCAGNNAHVLRLISQYHVSKVVLAAWWEHDFSPGTGGLQKLSVTVAMLRKRGIQVAVIGDNPAFPFSNPQYLGVRLARRANPNEPFYAAAANDFGLNQRLAQAVAPATFFDPMRHLCRKDMCLAYRNDHLMMRDDSHLSTYGAKLILSQMGGLFR